MKNTNPDLRVPKQRIAVEVYLRSGGKRRVELFLAEYQGQNLRPEDVPDLLESTDPFLPAYDPKEDRITLIGRMNILYVAQSIETGDESSIVADVLFDIQRPVTITLTDGTTYQGDLLYSAPRGRARSIDHVNGASRFLPLYLEKRILLLNKAAIVEIADRTTID
jgi:hypothetical protein